MNENTKKIIELSDGVRSAKEIGEMTGLSRQYVGKVMVRLDLPRLHRGSQPGHNNHQYRGGRRIEADGYVLTGGGHGRPRIAEHRSVMEEMLGRKLTSIEVVDHIDGLTLHNAPENLRLFASNAEHLKATITGTRRSWSNQGLLNIGTRTDLGKVVKPVDTYRLRKERGDVRLRQILLIWLRPDINSQFLCGTRRWLEKAQIDYASRSNLELALQQLESRYAEDLCR